MLRLAFRTDVPKLQPPSKLSRVTCKSGYHLCCIALLTSPGEDQHGLLRFSQRCSFHASTHLHSKDVNDSTGAHTLADDRIADLETKVMDFKKEMDKLKKDAFYYGVSLTLRGMCQFLTRSRPWLRGCQSASGAVTLDRHFAIAGGGERHDVAMGF